MDLIVETKEGYEQWVKLFEHFWNEIFQKHHDDEITLCIFHDMKFDHPNWYSKYCAEHPEFDCQQIVYRAAKTQAKLVKVQEENKKNLQKIKTLRKIVSITVGLLLLDIILVLTYIYFKC